MNTNRTTACASWHKPPGALGMTANNASVSLHRARAALREKLLDFCGDCWCLDDRGCD